MALWRLVSEKYFNGTYWSNTYVLQADNLADAVDAAQAVRNVEKTAHFNTVAFTKYRVSDVLVDTDVYQVITENDTGDLIAGGQELLPLFNRIRVDFNTVGGGRPSRKYLCPPVAESFQASGVLVPASLGFMPGYIAGMLAIPEFVDVDGQAFSGGSYTLVVGMRQLRRGSKRKVLPIIPEE